MRFSRTNAFLLALVCVAATVFSAVGQQPSKDESATVRLSAEAESGADGHQRMLDLLEQIRRRGPVENIYTGANLHASEREQLTALPTDAPNREKARLHLIVGKDELRLGNNRDAVEHLLAAYKLSDKGAVQPAFQLAIAYLRLGEAENCLAHRNPESCILPIRGGGIHREQAGARNAIEYLKEVLEKQPGHLTARWLLNLAHMTVGEYPGNVPEQLLIPPERFKARADFPPFHEVAADLGLNTLTLSGGVIADDFDNDGWLDIVVSDWSPSGQLRLFQNGGDGTFSERTKQAGLAGLFGGLNLIQADYDNDGDTDIYVMRGAWLEKVGRSYPNSLLQNDGNGRFRDVTLEAGLGKAHFPTQTAAWADYDNDGDTDLYVGNENFPSQLFRNNGDRTFTDVAREAGVTNDDFAKAVIWGDYDSDRFPDLYVSNFGGANRLYHNNGDGTFTDAAPDAGVTYPFKSFPAWFWDFNNDGNLDLFVSGYEWNVRDVAADYLGLPAMDTELDSLYQGDGKGGFRQAGPDVNFTQITQPMGSNFGDLDNDGFPDFYLGTGYPDYDGLMPNLLFHNRGGERFVDVTIAAGVGHLQKGHGVAFADFDHDGDQDIFSELGGAFAGDVFGNALFENPGFGNHWIVVKLIGVESNRSAIGASIRAEITEGGEKRSVYKWVNSGGSFGANPLRRHIGLGSAEKIDTLEVYWPATDQTQQFRDLGVNQFIAITEGEEEYSTLPYRPVKLTSEHAN